MQSTITERLDAIMKARGMTRHRLDTAAGLNDVTRSILEGRTRTPTLATLATLASALGVGVTDFLDSPEDARTPEAAARLTRVRRALGATPEAFAAQMSVSVETYALYESGLLRIPLAGALKLHDVYGVSLDYLFKGRLDHLPLTTRNALAAEE